jgi:predicted small lipoprotein YifL
MSGMMHQSKIVVTRAELPHRPGKHGAAAHGLCRATAFRLACAGLVAAILTGCGQKGSLYLPAPSTAPINATSAPTP